MLTVGLEPDAVKPFMGRLLREDLFDGFHVHSVVILGTLRITIDCTVAALDEAATVPKTEYADWTAVRPLVYDILRKNTKPKSVKIVFSYAAAHEIHKNASALFLNMTYEADGVMFTTGSSQRNFDLDKSVDRLWGEYVMQFFARAGVRVVER